MKKPQITLHPRPPPQRQPRNSNTHLYAHMPNPSSTNRQGFYLTLVSQFS